MCRNSGAIQWRYGMKVTDGVILVDGWEHLHTLHNCRHIIASVQCVQHTV